MLPRAVSVTIDTTVANVKLLNRLSGYDKGGLCWLNMPWRRSKSWSFMRVHSPLHQRNMARAMHQILTGCKTLFALWFCSDLDLVKGTIFHWTIFKLEVSSYPFVGYSWESNVNWPVKLATCSILHLLGTIFRLLQWFVYSSLDVSSGRAKSLPLDSIGRVSVSMTRPSIKQAITGWGLLQTHSATFDILCWAPYFQQLITPKLPFSDDQLRKVQNMSKREVKVKICSFCLNGETYNWKVKRRRLLTRLRFSWPLLKLIRLRRSLAKFCQQTKLCAVRLNYFDRKLTLGMTREIESQYLEASEFWFLSAQRLCAWFYHLTSTSSGVQHATEFDTTSVKVLTSLGANFQQQNTFLSASLVIAARDLAIGCSPRLEVEMWCVVLFLVDSSWRNAVTLGARKKCWRTKCPIPSVRVPNNHKWFHKTFFFFAKVVCASLPEMQKKIPS